MNIVIVLFSTFSFFILNVPKQSYERYEIAIDYIKKDSSRSNNFQMDDAGFVVDKKLIDFNLMTVVDDIIKEEYIPSYSIFRELSDDEIRIRHAVTDSLQSKEEAINKNEVKSFNRLDKLSIIKKNNYFISFSCLKEDYLYAEVGRNKIEAYGEVWCYLFLFEKNRIKKVYSGVISRN